MAFLPPYLLNAWRLKHGDEQQALDVGELKGWTVSSLAEFFIKYQLEKHQETGRPKNPLPSLSSMATGRVLDILQSSEDLISDARIIAQSLSSTTLRQLLEDPRTPYPVLRALYSLPEMMVGKKRKLVDIDEAVIRNEHHIRARGALNRDSKYLVSLEDLCSVISETARDTKRKHRCSADKKPMTFTRTDPPKGGLEVLDYWRSRQMHIQPNDATFSQVFDRITNGILRGLDWSNIMVAGGMVLTTLLHTDPAKDNDRAVKDPDIDLYVYGLDPREANRKAEEIHDTWARNLPASAGSRLVVKNAKTINLLTSYPNRRIQIVLKLPPTPTDVVLNFDLDACALGFDGSHIFMLPRCARAIETGYSIFTMDLIWGHHLGNRRASQENRIFKYAERGFGIRFLPSYARSLEEECLEQAVFNASSPSAANEETNESDRASETYRWRQRNRQPDGEEPGLKTMRRIAYLGQDYVQRYYFGVSPLLISPKQMRKQLKSQGLRTTDAVPDDVLDKEEELWWEMYNEAERENRLLKEANDRRRANEKPCEGPLIALSDLDTGGIYSGLPDGRRGLGNLEIFMRHCEAWRLHAHADATLDMTLTASLVYDLETYDDFPTYIWDENFNVAHFERSIDSHNSALWAKAKEVICGKLGITSRLTGFTDYSTRRVRRHVYGTTLKSVQEKQITIPVNIPFALENYLMTVLPQEHDDLPSHYTNFKPLIPIHDPTTYNSSASGIPSLRDTAAQSGNLRYWVITNESMWASQHPVLDEFTEIMWVLAHWLNQAVSPLFDTSTRTLQDNSLGCRQLARSFRRRIVLPEVPANQTEQSIAMKSGLPSLRESLLFRPWALISPAKPDRQFTESHGTVHELFEEDAVLYPFPDHLFWDPGDEGSWDEEGFPEWTEVPA